jgi:hypothetical protein
MMDKKATLDEIFAEARAEKPVMTREESWRVVRSSPPSSSTRKSSPWRWKIFLGMVAILAGITIWLNWPEQQNELVQSQRMAVPSGKSTLPVVVTEKSAPDQEKSGVATLATINNSNSGTSHSDHSGAITPKGSVQPSALKNPAITTNTKSDMQKMSGIGMIDPPRWLLDSLDIRVTDSGKVYYDPAPLGDNERALVFQLPAVDMPVFIPLAEAPHITPWPGRKNKWCRMISDDRGKNVARKTIYERDGDASHDYSDLLLQPQLQDTAKLSQQQVDELLRKVDSVRSARGIVSYERLFDINRLIPVRINVPNHVQANWYPSSYYVFWYDPTPELLSVLPDMTLAQIRDELTAATLALPDTGYIRRWNEQFVTTLQTSVDSLLNLRRRNGKFVPAEDVKPSPGTGFLTIGQTSSGALSIIALAPNPNSGSARLRYLLRERREVEVSLHDIHGRQLQILLQREPQSQGEHESQITAVDIPPGIYLLVLSTDKGERAVQRLIIE